MPVRELAFFLLPLFSDWLKTGIKGIYILPAMKQTI